MDVVYGDSELECIERDITQNGGFDQDIVRQFRRVMLLIRSVPNASELYRYPSRHFEKLKGKRQHQHSLRLNKIWRLIVEVTEPTSANCLRIVEITNHYQ